MKQLGRFISISLFSFCFALPLHAGTRSPEAKMQHNMKDAYNMGFILFTADDISNDHGFVGDAEHRNFKSSEYKKFPGLFDFVELANEDNSSHMGDPLR